MFLVPWPSFIAGSIFLWSDFHCVPSVLALPGWPGVVATFATVWFHFQGGAGKTPRIKTAKPVFAGWLFTLKSFPLGYCCGLCTLWLMLCIGFVSNYFNAISSGFHPVKLGWFVLLGVVLGKFEILEGLRSMVYIVVVLCFRNGSLVQWNFRFALKLIFLRKYHSQTLNPSDNHDNRE